MKLLNIGNRNFVEPTRALGIAVEVRFIESCSGNRRAAIEHGIAIQFCFKKRCLKTFIKGDAITEIVPFDLLKTPDELRFIDFFGAFHPIDPQPFGFHP